MALRGEATVLIKRGEGERPSAGSTVSLDDLTMFETVFEVPMEEARSFVPRVCEMEFPVTARLAFWSWQDEQGRVDSSFSHLVDVRIGCRRGAARMSWPLVALFDGDETTGHALREVGLNWVPGTSRIDIAHDRIRARATSTGGGAISCEMAEMTEIDPHELQWNIASLLVPIEEAVGTGTPLLGLAPVHHTFATLRTGRPRVAEERVELGGVSMSVATPIGGLLGHGAVTIGPLSEITT